VIKVDAEVVIGRPLAEVFAFVTDLRNDARWWTSVIRSTRSHGSGGVGSRYQVDARLLGVRDTWEIEVTAQDPPRRQTIVGRGSLPYTCHYDFTAHATGTRFLMTAEIAPSGPWRLLGPLFRPVIRAVMRHHMRRLDRILTG